MLLTMITVFYACNQNTKPQSLDTKLIDRGEIDLSSVDDYSHTESPTVRRLVDFILTVENSDRFLSQKFFDSSKSVEVVSIIAQKVYTIYYSSDGNYLAISARPNRKAFAANTRFACADEWLDGRADFGFVGDSTTPKKNSRYFAQTNMFASSDETMVLDNHDYWQEVYRQSLSEIVAYYKL